MSTTAKPFANPIIAALESCAKRRHRAAAPAGSAAPEPDPISRTVDIIDAAAAKIEANDFSGIEYALAAQALSLDVIFDQFARYSATGSSLFHPPMHMALRAQS